jgi:hypothetical protein
MYTSGSLELCLLGLEHYSHTLDKAVFTAHTLPLCSSVLQYYKSRYPNLNTTTGKTDYFPSQMIEVSTTCTTRTTRTTRTTLTHLS